MKTVGGLRKTHYCVRALVEWFFVLSAAAYNPSRPQDHRRDRINPSRVTNMRKKGIDFLCKILMRRAICPLATFHGTA
jgi:hypothetical protein